MTSLKYKDNDVTHGDWSADDWVWSADVKHGPVDPVAGKTTGVVGI